MSPSQDSTWLREPLQHHCASCIAKHTNLLRCTGCRLVRYCNREHQRQHRPQHKGRCKKMAELRDNLQQQKRLVLNNVPSAFDTHSGRLSEERNAHPYMRARFAVGELAALSGTLDGAVLALYHFLGLGQLDRSDDMELQENITILILSLDQDQECYDFIKWWETAGSEEHHDWADMSLPFLNVKDADVLEEPTFLYNQSLFQNRCAILFLKIKLVVDIGNIKLARKVLHNRLPAELWPLVERDVVRSPLSARFIGRIDLQPIQNTLMKQCHALYVQTDKSNRHYMSGVWSFLWPGEERKYFRPNSGPPGLPREDGPWWKTPGTLDLWQEARKCAALEKELEDDAKERKAPIWDGITCTKPPSTPSMTHT